MEKWRFYGERNQDGLTYLLGKQDDDPAIYRWEPLVKPLSGLPAGEFRKTINQRSQVLAACQNRGLLGIVGPIRYENRLWVGWQNPDGRNPFDSVVNSGELVNLIRDLLPLVRAYELVHLTGLVIGTPDWGRLTRSTAGYQQPDPWIKDYLAHSTRVLPPGLTDIHPPELSQSAEFSQTADLFYLGLLLYCLIGGKIPYSLKNRWPHGRLLPLTYCRPQLTSALSNLITDLLAPDPEDRPTIREVRLQWQKSLDPPAYLATARDYTTNLHKNHYYSLELRLSNWLARLKIPLVIFVLFGLLGLGYARWRNRPGPSAEKIVRQLFETPLAATPLLNSPGCSGLIAKLNAEKARRYAVIRDLTSQPYVKIKALKALSHSPEQTTLLLTLEWRTWQRGHWQNKIRREKMILSKQQRTWRIIRAESVNFP